MSKDDLGVPYQLAGQVRQALAERQNAQDLGLTSRVEAADKTLAQLGYSEPEKAPKVARDEPPADRRAGHERTEKAEGDKPDADKPNHDRRQARRHTA